jgi:hypothetical protein
MAMLVATIPVQTPANEVTAPTAEPGGTTPAAPGAAVTVVDRLTGDELVEGRPPAVVAVQAGAPLRRYYLAVAFSTRDRPGPQPPAATVALFDAPLPPAGLRAAVHENETTLTWEPGGGLVGFLMATAMPDEPAPGDDPFALPAPTADPAGDTAVRPAGPLKYNVYTSPVTPQAAAIGTTPVTTTPEIAWQTSKPVPLNPQPLAATAFVTPAEFGREQCFVVRAIRGSGTNTLEGDASAPLCFTPADRFPPAPPAGLVAVAAERAMSLIWEPASEPDLAGYLVLRGTAGDATLQPLTPMPITEARFIDTTVTPGTRYVYAVQSVDTAMNVSAISNRTEETAR